MYGLNFKSGDTWPVDKCNVNRCAETPDYLFPQVDMWPGKKPPRDVRLCAKHMEKSEKEYARQKIEMPPHEAVVRVDMVIQGDATAPLVEVEVVDSNAAPETALVPGLGEVTLATNVGELRDMLFEAATEKKAALAIKAKELLESLAEAETTAIEDVETQGCAEELLAEVKLEHKALDEERKDVTGVLNAVVKEVNSWFNPGLNTLLKIKETWEDKLRAFRAAQEVERQRLLDEAQAAAAAGAAEETRNALVAASAATPAKSTGTAIYIDNWKFEITDLELLLKQVGYTKLVPDVEVIEATVATYKDKTNIPGVRVFNLQTIRS